MIRVRAIKGSPPYKYELLNSSDVVIVDVTTSDEEVNFTTNPIGVFKYRITDNDGNTITKIVNDVEASILKKYYSGQRLDYAPNDTDLENNYNAGFRSMGVMFDISDNVYPGNTPYATSQQAWDLLGSPFDHTVPIVGQPLCPMDKVVRKAYELNMPLLMGVKTSIRQQYLTGEPEGNTWSYHKNDIAMRPDGVTGIDALSPRDGNGDLIHPVTFMVGSTATTGFKLYCANLLQKVVNRYKAALNSGLIIAIGLNYTTAVEGEFSFHLHTPGVPSDDEIKSIGDFHSQMVNGFKTQFPQYASLNNNDIKNGTGDLEKHWWWYNTERLKECSWGAIDYTISNTTGLTRNKWYLQSVGAYSDILGKWRKTYNINEFFKHDTMFVVKTNADPTGVDYELDLVSSIALKCGGTAWFEISPPGNVNTEENRWKIVEGATKAMNRNVNVVFPVSDWGVLNEIKNNSNILSKTTNSVRQDITTQSGIKKIVSMEFPLSTMIQEGHNGTANSQRQALMSNSGTNSVYIEIKDNVKP